MKFIFVSGGVISGLGKGITAASIGLLLESRGLVVTNIKIDMYLNVDAGTIRPQEHGEVFVCDDGIETDQDIGHYERFLNRSLSRENYMTTGSVYLSVINRERAFGYKGEDVEAIPHVTDEIINRIKKAGKVHKAKVVIIELGGTVGEYQNGIFFEAARIMKLKWPMDVIHIHVSYLPVIKSIGELKSKPTQQSVGVLNSMGIQPDFLVARSEVEIDQRRRSRLALFCNMRDEDIIANPDLVSIYNVPLFLEKQNISTKIIKKLGLRNRKIDLSGWIRFVNGMEQPKREVRIAMVGKYFATGNYVLSDSYVCVIEALKHAGAVLNIKPVLTWINSEDLEKNKVNLIGFDGIIVPQGWGSRGTEGKIMAIKYARENKIPFLGLCFGMQMAVVEFARNVLSFKKANSEEIDPNTKYKVIHLMPDQVKYLKKHNYGGTIRLGSWPCQILPNSLLSKIYRNKSTPNPSSPARIYGFDKEGVVVYERHRHRYEFNNVFRGQLEAAGMVVSGTSPDGELVEAIEIKDHPFFVGTQFHPEYKSRPLEPHPIFMAFVKAAGQY